MKNTLKTLTGLAAVASISAMASFGAHAQSNQIEAKDRYTGANYQITIYEGCVCRATGEGYQGMDSQGKN